MQWQRVIHGCGDVIENAGRVHSMYEFTLKGLPKQIVRVRIVETPEGQFFGLPNQTLVFDDQPLPLYVPATPAHTPEKALHDVLCYFSAHAKPPCDKVRLLPVQNW